VTHPLRRGAVQAGLVTAALGAVLIAPLAVPTTTAAPQQSGTVISGATSLKDTVSVTFSHPAPGTRTTPLHVLAWNDFHGNLEPDGLNIYGRFAGGAAYLARAVKDRQDSYRRSLSVIAGDNIGASPLVNGLFREEPATIVTNLMRADFASVGNHEFDKGWRELLRIANGGCPAAGCNGAPYTLPSGRTTNRYPGATFRYLSANVLRDNGRTLFPATGVKWYRGDSGRRFGVGVIGEVLKETPTIVTPAGVAGLTFTDEAEAANKAAADLKKKGVGLPILVIHQGGFQQPTSTLNGCVGNLAGTDIERIAKNLDPSIKIIVSGHTHAEYRCTITTNGVTRLVTSASSFGRVLSDLTLIVNDRTGELVRADAQNVIVENALNAPGTNVTRQPDPTKADPQVQAVVDQYVTASAPLANKVIGRIQGDMTRTPSPLGEQPLGDVIADAQLAATAPANLGGAQVAFMNPGGIRADLKVSDISSGGEAPGEVTYGEAFTVQPFGNSLVTKTMTGAQIRSLLEQQVPGCGGQTQSRTLQVSSTFKYERAATPPPAPPAGGSLPADVCAAQIGRIWINGVEVTPAATYRVTMNNFLASGGDGFTVFNQGTDSLGGAQDIDAFAAYLTAAGATGVAVPPLNRIVPKPA
jgi:5'-nucleotidase